MTLAPACTRLRRARVRASRGLLAALLAGVAPATVAAQGAPRHAELAVIPAPASAVPFGGAWPLPTTLITDVAFVSDSQLAANGIRVRIAPAWR